MAFGAAEVVEMTISLYLQADSANAFGAAEAGNEVPQAEQLILDDELQVNI
jgi:hypothetical protein